MEELVTDKIEDVCKQTTGFESVKSESYANASVVRMMFSKELSGDKLDDCIDELRVSIDDLKENDLPSGITKLTVNDNAFETCGIILAFTGEDRSNEELSQRAETLKDNILGTEGVIRADVEGNLERQVKITVDYDSKHYRYNGDEAVILSVYFDEDYNVLDVSDEVQEIIDDYEATIPKEVEINRVVYLADEVDSSIKDFLLNLLESVVIVLFIVMIGMNIRNGSIVAFVIPFTIFLTFIAMKVLSIDVQFVSLASLIIALGMLVDNAVVVSDAIQIRIDNGEEKIDACVNGAKEVALPVFSSMLTTVVIFCIFYNLPGTMRRFIFGLPTIVITALVFSYIVSMLVTPLMCFMFMKESVAPKRERREYLREFFTKLLQISLSNPKRTAVIAVLCILTGIRLLTLRELQLMPNSDKLLLDVDIETDNMYDLKNTEKAVDAVSDIIADEENVEYYLASIGGRVPKYDFTTVASTDATNSGSLVLKIKKPKGMAKAEYCKYLEDKLKPVMSAKVTVKEIGIMPKASEAVQLNLCGEDIDSINEAARKAEELLREDSDAKDVYADFKVQNYDYFINMDNEALNSFGLTKGGSAE